MTSAVQFRRFALGKTEVLELLSPFNIRIHVGPNWKVGCGFGVSKCVRVRV
jgi:hypothetical protein